MTAAADPLTVDEHGFVVGTVRAAGAFGSRPSVGGLGARVATQEGRCAVIVGMGNVEETGGLLLSVVWLAACRAAGGPTETETEAALDAYDRGDVQPHDILAAGLVALDAWMGDQLAAADPWAQHGPGWCPDGAVTDVHHAAGAR